MPGILVMDDTVSVNKSGFMHQENAGFSLAMNQYIGIYSFLWVSGFDTSIVQYQCREANHFVAHEFFKRLN